WCCSSAREGPSHAPAGRAGPAHATESYWSWHWTHPEKSAGPGRTTFAAAASSGAPGQCRAGLVRWHGVSFFICQPYFLQYVMDGWQRAIQGRGPAQLLQGQVRLAAQELTKGLGLSGDFAGLEPAEMITRADVAALAPPLQKFLDHAQRDSKAVGDLLSGPFLL